MTLLTSRRRLTLLLLGVLWLLAPSTPRAVDLRDVLTGYTFTSWSRKDGLVGPVWAIAQDANGFLWLGTDGGLLRFDGVRFISWEGLGGQPLPRLPIRALHVSPAGTLWVGFGGGGGMARIDNRAVSTFVSSDGTDSTGAVTSIMEDPAGTIWSSTASGLFRLAGTHWEHVGAKEGLPEETPVNAFIDRGGALWVSTTDGLYRRGNADEGPFERIEPAYDPQRTLSLSQDPAGRIWATDSPLGFRALGDGPALRGTLPGRGYRLLHDRDGNLWVATIGQGLWRVRYLPGARQPLTVERTTVLSGLSSDAVRTVFEDRDGNIWAGTTEGVDRLVPHRVTPWTNLGLVNTIDSTSDGRVWAGTADGLIAFGRGPGGWEPAEARVPIRSVTAVRSAVTGGLWVSTPTTLYRVQDTSVVPIPAPRTTRTLAIEALATDAQGEAWIVTSGGEVMRTEGGQLRTIDRIPELRGVRTNAAMVDRRNHLWVSYGGTHIGVVGGPGEFQTFGDAGLGTGLHYDLYEDADGTIWICGVDGLSRFTGDRFAMVGRANGLPAGGVYSITQDGRDDLWLATASGIIRLSLSEFDRAARQPQYVLRFRIYDTSDGLAGYPVTLGDRNALRAADGTLWFVTSRGISVVNPRTLATQRQAPLVAIDEARANDVRIEGNVLPPGTSKLEIDYTAPELTSPLKTRFRYRLEGLDADWVDAGTRREALYTNLQPRDYTFRLAVSQDDGRWSETEATWSFTLRPRFFQTWWFVALMAMTTVAVLWGAWEIRVRQLRRQFALVLGERVRLSRELHDTLLQSLVGVALEFDAVSKSIDSSPAAARARVIKIREQVEEYIREARRSIWSLRSPTLDTGDLIEALRDSAARALSGHDEVAFTFEQSGDRHRVPSTVEHQILRISQEALLNAVRHSGATAITMHLHFAPDALTLTVRDNGRGFDVSRSAEGTTDHYGLTTMRERAQQAGGQLTITSTPGHGTIVDARVPAREDHAARDGMN
jgi:signal transduction histidine kinase/ligand-binding sensor domain-containing protein